MTVFIVPPRNVPIYANIYRDHFLNYLTWRRRKGPQMFMKYAGMTMEARDPLVAEWANTIRVEEAPTAAAPKS
ncbi:MAG: hypothetical protein SGJ26_06315 [Nitrospirota bacterium]|nr:hypothetical protein [Nitrospirota bacterium]